MITLKHSRQTDNPLKALDIEIEQRGNNNFSATILYLRRSKTDKSPVQVFNRPSAAQAVNELVDIVNSQKVWYQEYDEDYICQNEFRWLRYTTDEEIAAHLRAIQRRRNWGCLMLLAGIVAASYLIWCV